MDCEKAMSFCPEYLQFNFSLLDQRGRSFLKSEKAQRIRIVVRSPFCSGLLSSSVIDYQRISAPLRRNTRLLDKLVPIREIFESCIARHGLSVPEVAFRFALSYANVDYVISSFMSEGDITSAVRYEKSGPLAKGLTEELEELWEE
jgi:aryl-alcohol dehydrogenase-like predicted oxidoreductase